MQHLNPKEYQVLRLSYGLDCDKHSAKEIASILGIKGSSSYHIDDCIRVLELVQRRILFKNKNLSQSERDF